MQRKCGRCRRMFEPEPGDTHKTCPRCREYLMAHRATRNQYTRERYSEYREHGICVTCGQNWVEPGYVRCKACIAKYWQQQKRYDPTGEKRREQAKARWKARADAGLCVDCGRPAEKGKRCCRRCLDMRCESARKARILRNMDDEARRAREASVTWKG